jgi:hypothetical protein
MYIAEYIERHFYINYDENTKHLLPLIEKHFKHIKCILYHNITNDMITFEYKFPPKPERLINLYNIINNKTIVSVDLDNNVLESLKYAYHVIQPKFLPNMLFATLFEYNNNHYICNINYKNLDLVMEHIKKTISGFNSLLVTNYETYKLEGVMSNSINDKFMSKLLDLQTHEILCETLVESNEYIKKNIIKYIGCH